jgi:hypothetical protein
MKAQRKALVEELLRTLAPHLAGVLKENNLPGKALTKTIHQLAEQLLRAQAKRHKRAQQGVGDTSQATQLRLTDALTTALDDEMADTNFSGKSSKKAKRAIADSAGHLAARLAKLRHKHTPKKLPAPPDAAAAAPEAAPAAKRTASPRQRRPPAS